MYYYAKGTDKDICLAADAFSEACMAGSSSGCTYMQKLIDNKEFNGMECVVESAKKCSSKIEINIK